MRFKSCCERRQSDSNCKGTAFEEMLKLLVLNLKNESQLREIKSTITGIKLEVVSKSRITCRSVKPSNNATGCSSKSIGVRASKILHIMFRHDPKFAKSKKVLNRNKLENFILYVQCYIYNNLHNNEILLKLESFCFRPSTFKLLQSITRLGFFEAYWWTVGTEWCVFAEWLIGKKLQ